MSRGIALIAALLLLAALSLLGLAVVNTACLDLRITAGLRRSAQAFQVADSGVVFAPGVIDWFIAVRPDPEGFPDNLPAELQEVVLEEQLLQELTTDGFAGDSAQDLGLSLQGRPLTVDVERQGAAYLPGASVEFGAGFEGLGKGSAAGGIGVDYRLDCTGGSGGARSEIEAIYRKVLNVLGGER